MKATLNTQKAMKYITIEVTVIDPVDAKVRRFFGLRLLRLAAFVMGCNIELKHGD